MKKRFLFVGVGAVVSTACAFALISPKADAQKSPAPVPSLTVNVVSAQKAVFARAVAATGTVGARDELSIGSDAGGVRLLEVLVDVGSTVRKGDLLARADDAQLQAQLAQQTAQVKQAQAEHAQAVSNFERAERLGDFFSVEAVQTRRTAVATAAAKLDLAQAQRRELEVRIGQTRVHAPSAGVISRRSATVGAVVQPGNELFRLIRDGELEWRAELPGHSLGSIVPGTPVRLLLDQGPSIEGRVRLVAPTIDTSTRNGVVYVALPRGTSFKAGAHARGEILIAAAQAPALPETAVLARDGYPFVYTVGPDSVARLKRIETGARQNGLVEVSGGLDAEARVVSTGAGFVKDGDLVRIAPRISPVTAQSGKAGQS